MSTIQSLRREIGLRSSGSVGGKAAGGCGCKGSGTATVRQHGSRSSLARLAESVLMTMEGSNHSGGTGVVIAGSTLKNIVSSASLRSRSRRMISGQINGSGLIVTSRAGATLLLVQFIEGGKYAGAVLDLERDDGDDDDDDVTVEYQCCVGHCVCPCYIIDHPPTDCPCDMTDCVGAGSAVDPTHGGSFDSDRFRRPGSLPPRLDSIPPGTLVRF